MDEVASGVEEKGNMQSCLDLKWKYILQEAKV